MLKLVPLINKRSINLQNKETMTKTITFNELRRIKDRLPDGSTPVSYTHLDVYKRQDED